MTALRRRLGVLAVVALLACAPAAAQPRDGALDESRREAAAIECRRDPQCAAVLKRRALDAERTEAAYQAKPLWQKLLGWLAIPAAFGLLWRWAGQPSNPPTPDNEKSNP